MFSQECFEASFEIAAPKTLKIIQQTHGVGFTLDKIARLQSPAYYRTKTFTTDYFSWSALKPSQNCPFYL